MSIKRNECSKEYNRLSCSLLYNIITRIDQRWLQDLPLRWMLGSEAADSAWDRCKANEFSKSLRWRLSSSLRSIKMLCRMHFSQSTVGLSSTWASSSDSSASPSMDALSSPVAKTEGKKGGCSTRSSLSNAATCEQTTLDQNVLRCQLFNNQCIVW